MKIYVEMPKGKTTDTFLTEENIALLESLGEVTWNETEDHLTPEQLRSVLADKDACVCGWGVPKFDSVVLEKAKNLKFIAYTAGSVANLVTDEMYEKGIRISCGNNGFAESVAEGTVAHILASLRRLKEYDARKTTTPWWDPNDFAPERLIEQTVGIVGYGAIAANVLKMLKPFRVKVKLYSRHTTEEKAAELGVQKASLEEIFSTCKIVSLHCAQSPETFHMVDDRLLSMMMPGALLVNTSRGSVIDEAAMAKHVLEGHIRVSLDVYEREPIPADSPLRQLDESIIMQPHLGGPTLDYRPVAARYAIEDLARWQKGEPLEHEVTAARSKTMSKKK